MNEWINMNEWMNKLIIKIRINKSKQSQYQIFLQILDKINKNFKNYWFWKNTWWESYFDFQLKLRSGTAVTRAVRYPRTVEIRQNWHLEALFLEEKTLNLIALRTKKIYRKSKRMEENREKRKKKKE